MKIYLTGASGLVGSAFAQAATRRGHHVVGVVGKYSGELTGLAKRASLDLTSEDAITRSVLDEFPDLIVNCAAVSEPAACSENPALSQILNVVLPTRLAQLANHVGARLLHLSSEQVFDGNKKTPYSAEDAVSPINLYGEQKVASERALMTLVPRSGAIVRAPLLLGNSPAGRRALHERLFTDWSLGRTVRLYIDEFRQPCSADNLADILVELGERPDACGIFHWAGTELVSRFDLGMQLRKHFKLSEQAAPIVGTNRATTPEIARGRQACLALDIGPLSARSKTRPQSIRDQFAGLRIPLPSRDWYLRQT